MRRRSLSRRRPASEAARKGRPRRGLLGWRWASVAGLVTLVTAVPALPAHATYEGDNGRIAFRRFLNQERTWGAVFTIKPNGREERQITHPATGFVDRNPDVSPNGRKIAFEREQVDCTDVCSDEVFVVDADGTHLRQLTHNVPGQGCGTGGTCSGTPAWSPDGRTIALQRASGLVVGDLIENVGIAIMNADGSNLHAVTQRARPSQGEDSNPQFSPDGRQLVFQRNNVRDAQPEGGVALFILDLPTGREHQVTPWPMRAGDTPDWSPDGKRILFHNNLDNPPDVSPNLFTIRPDGTGLRQLTFATGGNPQYLGSSFSPDGRYITVGRKPETGGVNADVLVLTADGAFVRNLTRSDLYDSYPDWGPAAED